jgi:hypothetical protein
LQRCDRFNVNGLSILDSDGVGLLLDRCTRSQLSGCLVRDDREERKSAGSIKAVGGEQNAILGIADGARP